MSTFPMRPHSGLAIACTLALTVCVAPALAQGRVNLSSLDSINYGGFNRFVVKYRDGSAPRRDTKALDGGLGRAAASLARADRHLQLTLQRLRRAATGADVVYSNRKLARADAARLMQQIASDPNVEYVEVDQLRVPYLAPNDPRFAEQYGFGVGAGGVHAERAWDRSTGAGVVVAVVDTGITAHSDLNANVLPGYDFISREPDWANLPGDGFYMANDNDARDANPSDPGDWVNARTCDPEAEDVDIDSSWHGTHVAGTVAAVTNNGRGVAGTAHGAQILPIRVLGRCGGFSTDIADGVIWAAGGQVPGIPANPNPAEVINLSLGGRTPNACDDTTRNAFQLATQLGAIVVVAAGNENSNAALYTNNNCGNVISVASVDSRGRRSPFSNFGETVDIAAPGSAILSTYNTGRTIPEIETYAELNGTSMAAPHVAGVAALVQSAAIQAGKAPLNLEQMRALLRDTARPFAAAPDRAIGAGVVDAEAAVNRILDGAPAAAQQVYSNTADVAIPDNNLAGASSSIVVADRIGKAPRDASVTINILHSFKGDLKVDLIAPDGSIYNLHRNTGSSADNVTGTFKLDLSSEDLNGTWKLRVIDSSALDVGKIDAWSIQF